MFRRRLRRSSRFSSGAAPLPRAVLIGVAGAAVLGAFVFFFIQADTLAPEPQEIRIALPDALKTESRP
jgi:hypothetical protein